MNKLMRAGLLVWFLIVMILPSMRVQAQTGGTALWMDFEGPLTPVLVGYVERGIDQAEAQGRDLIILRLNTPGGQIDMMEKIVASIRASQVPVVVYVAPSGAMAGSAGTIITLAGHASAMAPETIIGAASPINSTGEDIEATAETKLKEAMKASVRSLMERRSPESVELAEATIEEARAVSANEALRVGLVDIIAVDQADLLRQLDGRTVWVLQKEMVLQTTYMQVVTVPLTIVEELLQMLTNPNLVFILLSLGIQAIFIELSSPGGWVAGFIGVVAVSLAVYGMGILPVNYFGLVFLLTAFVLFIIDIKAPTHGALTLAGIGSFIAGSLILFNSVRIPGVPVISIPLVIGTGVFLAVSFSIIITFAIRALKAPPRMGDAMLIGKTAYVKEKLDPVGQVRIAGELWSAELVDVDSQPALEGTQVIIEGMEGVRLRVRIK